MTTAHDRPLPWLTADQPGIGGALKTVLEDFVVEELPAYEPCGEGSHLFLWIEKRNVAADQLVTHLARTLGVSRAAIGMAGLKDRQGVTRQSVSVPAEAAPNLGKVDTPEITLLRAVLHRNKLRTGHLRGNRFEVVVRTPSAPDLNRVKRIADVIDRMGFPNYYGEQRFGLGGETLALGLDLLRGLKTPRDIPPHKRRFLLRLSLSAVQSQLFNEVLARRLEDGLLHRVLAGDLLQVTATGGPFVAVDVCREQRRCEAGETVITGPMFGPKMRMPAGDAASRERAVLEECGLTLAEFAVWKKLLPGTRRPLVARAVGLTCDPVAGGVRLSFTLASGVYATSLLREFQKFDTPPSCDPTADDLPAAQSLNETDTET
jgi:tRNA pseudouridine13 synthase